MSEEQKPFSVATVIEKSRVYSETAIVILLEIYITDAYSGDLVETVYVARNNENITFNGNTYYAANFSIKTSQSQDTEGSVSLAVSDIQGVFAQRIESYIGEHNFNVKMMTVNTARLDKPVEATDKFLVKTATVSNYVATFTLGAENALNMRFPPKKQFRDRCRWRFRSSQCGYIGAEPSCDYTLDGVNGCKAKGNTQRYGGFRGIQPMNV